jgi:uncharacterized protein (DUF1501 family)
MTHEHSSLADSCPEGRFLLNRRSALFGLGAALAFGRMPLARAQTAGSVPRLVVIDAMGGLDGLSVVAPYGDPNLAVLRAQIMAPAVGKRGGMLDLGGFFGLHPAMPNLHAMYKAGEAAMVHAVGNAGLTRSHFEGQDYLQSGAPEILSSGWLNRVMGLIPGNGSMQSGISLSNCDPLLVRGPTVAAGWAPDPFLQMGGQTAIDLANLLAPDTLLGPAYQVAFQDRASFNAVLQADPMPAGLSNLQQLAWAAGQFLASPAGPTIAAIQTSSCDTHDNQVIRLNSYLADLDGVFLQLKQSLRAAWSSTVVMTMTEFGRTAAANGGRLSGTDHGTGFAVLLAGGAVAGGQVYGTWPGLSASTLYDGRDLAPTTDIRSIAMGILQQHMGLPASAMGTVFPGVSVQAMNGLVS